MARPARGTRARALLAALLSGMFCESAGAEGILEGSDGRSRLGVAFRLAVREVAARLQDPGCAAVLEDFQDTRTGHQLARRLAETGQSASEYFSRWLSFRSGRGSRPCENSAVIAYTSPGSRVVFVCGDQFLAAWRKSEAHTVSTLIHEALHTLGLGENPPDSKVITARVQARCGR